MPTDWIARRNVTKPLEVKTIDKAFAGIPAGASMLIVTPKMVDALVRELKAGEFVSQSDLRELLAKRNGAEYACPVTTGISLRVIAEAAYVEITSGTDESEVAPFWRAIDPKDKLALKLECGKEFLEKKRKQESR